MVLDVVSRTTTNTSRCSYNQYESTKNHNSVFHNQHDSSSLLYCHRSYEGYDEMQVPRIKIVITNLIEHNPIVRLFHNQLDREKNEFSNHLVINQARVVL